MKRFTKRDLIQNLIKSASSIRKSAPKLGILHDPEYRKSLDEQVATAKKLEALDPVKCSLEEVSEICGEFATELLCSECGKDQNLVIELGPPDSEEMFICAECLNKALKLISK